MRKLSFSVFVFVISFSITGCLSRKEVKGMIDEIEKEMERVASIEPESKMTKDEISQMIDQKIDYHKKNWPHGCEVNCK